MNNDLVKKILIEGNYANEADITRVASTMSRNQTLADALIADGIISSEILGQAVAESYKVPYANMVAHPPTREYVLTIPLDIAQKYRVVVFSADQAKVTIASDGPIQPEAQTVLQEVFKGKELAFAYSLPEQIDAQFSVYQKSLETRFSKIIKENDRVAPEIMDEIVNDAVNLHASDVHFEPTGEEVVIRFRIDGVMQEAGRIKKVFYDNILNRVKVQAKLRIDEHYAAQDGSIRHQREDKFVDLRISIVPTVDGEKIVIRILGEYVRGFTLADIGLSKEDEATIKEAAEKPFGMILVVGPTGSGKTTTLYALLRLINSPKVNITTIEDPVEYHLAGINQIQVNPATDLTFAKGLRSIVRQDPDIVLVGEIRDQETAEIAVNAALTGHLLLSTFHANDAATVIPRLLTMGIEPFLLSSTLELIVSQRLVRKLCMHCRHSVEYTNETLLAQFPQVAQFFPEKTITLYEGKGCESCNNTGFMGRNAIFEFVKISRAIEDLIIKNPSSGQVWDMARKEGARSMFEDGITKVKSGITTITELLRVAEPPRQNETV